MNALNIILDTLKDIFRSAPWAYFYKFRVAKLICEHPELSEEKVKHIT